MDLVDHSYFFHIFDFFSLTDDPRDLKFCGKGLEVVQILICNFHDPRSINMDLMDLIPKTFEPFFYKTTSPKLLKFGKQIGYLL